MKLRRFVAPDARAGLEQIRQALGPDALVVTSRKIPGGIEMMAGTYASLGSETGQAEDNATHAQDGSGAGNAVWRELARLRALLQNQLAGFAWSADKRRHPVRVHIMQAMLTSGFSAQLARHIAAALPKDYAIAQADAWLRQVLIRNLRVFERQDQPGSRPGVWALVGPTGQGKTTTLAKLAAGAALKSGQEQVVLVSADTYRVGAQDQLQKYAELMGVALHGLSDIDELDRLLPAMPRAARVFIDCPGFAPGDPRLAAQASTLKRNGVTRLLALSAATQGSLAERLILQCEPAAVIATKLDEGGVFGPVLDCLMRHRVPLACIASGQRVPEDLYPANAAYVIDRVLRGREQGAFAMREEDWPVQAGMEAEAIPATDSAPGIRRQRS